MSIIRDAKSSVNIADVVGAYGIDLKRKGSELVGICPFHHDTKPSLHVNEKKQVFLCPVCDSKGDVIDFVTLREGCTKLEAAHKISGKQFTELQPQQRAPKTAKGTAVEWVQIYPAPMPGQIIHHSHGKPSARWEYRSADGELIGLICRFDTPDGKEILPFTYRTNGERKMWQWRGFDKPRPLYNLPAIGARATATVIVVEGEKTADAAQRLFPHCVVTTWQGGAKAVKATDWTPLHGRRVLLWPDNDQAGDEAVFDIAVLLHPTGGRLFIVHSPGEAPKHWDLADAEQEGWTPDKAKAYARANLVSLEDEPTEAVFLAHSGTNPEPAAAPPPPADVPTGGKDRADTGPPVQPPPPQHTQAHFTNDFFTVLGFEKDDNRQTFVFFAKAARSVLKYSASSLGTKTTLITLAPIDYWEDQYPTHKRGGGMNIEMAVQTLVMQANAVGVFSPRHIRGRGAWTDSRRVVLHLGDRLIVDGVEKPLGALRSRYVYEAGVRLDFENGTAPLTAKEAHKLIDICTLLNWERPINSYLLAGWCVIAPVCGALRWRPHIWITGGAGTGKSWTFKEVVRRVLGSSCLAVQSETSEAGLRQMIGNDAIPVVFDEAEGENRAAVERMEHVLALMRAASSNDGGVMAKGTATGGGRTFLIRSCFAFASINNPISLQSDRTRITNLVMVKLEDEAERSARWEALQTLCATTLTPTFIAGLQARTIHLMPRILMNIEVFTSAAAAHLGDQRVGDQIGAMLAGAFALSSDRVIEYREAFEWIAGKDWTEERATEGTRDELALLALLMDKSVRVDGLEGSPVDRNVGELVRVAAQFDADGKILVTQAQDRLKRIGMKIDGDYLAVSQDSQAIKGWLRDTAWSRNFHKTLLRLPGARTLPPTRFAGMQARAVGIPLSFIK